MGGSVNVAFRFNDGEAVCFDSWTNTLGQLSDIRIIQDNEQPAREYLNEYADAKPYGSPVRLSTSQYGLVLIDFVSKTMIDCNGYTTLFGNIHGFQIRKCDDEYFSRWYRLLNTALSAGISVIEENIGGKIPETTRYDSVDSMEEILKKNTLSPMSMSQIEFVYSVDVSPWRYHLLEDDTKGKRRALEIAREIDFPFTKKAGLNR